MSHPGISVRCPVSDCKRACKPRGWANNPKARRVLGLEKCYYLASYQYECPAAGHGKFYASNPCCIRKMPLYIQYQFPAILTKKLAIDLKVIFAQLMYIHDIFLYSLYNAFRLLDSFFPWQVLGLQHLSRWSWKLMQKSIPFKTSDIIVSGWKDGNITPTF